ncbi:MAG: hypothetical protein KDI79_21970 [Anaerolineae bacterium]|nr:hypothetical protein [Anaerolineae bacterium]
MNSEPTINQADKLDEALALLAAGVSLDEILAEAGDDAAWLRPMLELAAEVNALKADIPIPAPQASLDRLLAHANSMAAPAPAYSPGRPVPRPRFNLGRLLFNTGLSTAIAAALLFLVCVFGSLLGGGMVLAAEGSLPGQPLYPVKRLGETIRLTLTQDTRQRHQLEDTFNQRRVEEVNHLIEQRKAAPVRLSGRVEAVSAAWLTVDDLTIELAPETIIKGELAVGAQVRLEGQTNAAGQLVATSITVLEPAPPTPTPTPLPPTSTPIPTATATPPPPTATPTAASQSTSDTIKLIPTATPKPAPVEVETDDDGAGSDNSGPGSSNSGPGNSGGSDDNSGPGSGADDNNNNVSDDNSGPSDNSGSGSNDNTSEDNSGSGSSNSGSNDNGSDNRDDNSGSGSSNSGSGSSSGRDNNSGSGKNDDSGHDDD